MSEIACLLIGAGVSWYVLDRLYKRSIESRERIMRQQSEHIWDLARALNAKEGPVTVEPPSDRPDGWDPAWGEQCWTPERRGRR